MRSKTPLALFLVLVLCFSLLPIPSLAASTEPLQEPALSSAEPTADPASSEPVTEEATTPPDEDSAADPIVFTIYAQEGEAGTPEIVTQYTEAQLRAASTSGSLTYSWQKSDSKGDYTVTDYIPLQDLLGENFAAGDTLKYTCSDGEYTKSCPNTYETLITTSRYYHSSAVDTTGTLVPSVLSVENYKGSLSPRLYVGETDGPRTLAGSNWPSGLVAITIVHPVVFTVYEQEGETGTPEIVTQYTEAQLRAASTSGSLMYSWQKSDSKGDYTVTDYIPLQDLLGENFAAGDTLKYTCSDGEYTKSCPNTYETLITTSRYYHSSAVDTTGTLVPSVLSVENYKGSLSPRLYVGETDGPRTLAGSNWPSGLVAITIVHPETPDPSPSPDPKPGPENNKPGDDPKNHSPKTGDESTPVLWALCVLTVGVLLTVLPRKKHNR